MDVLRVLIADDKIIQRKQIAESVRLTNLGIVKHIASNGEIALDWLRQELFDVVLLDAAIAIDECMDTLHSIKKEFPGIAVIIMSDGTSQSAQITLEALKLGAMDFFIKTPDQDPEKSVQILKNKLQILFAQIRINDFSPSVREKVAPVVQIPIYKETNKWKGADIVLIASSTGGPASLEQVFEGIPADFNKPILVVQHMPAEFTRIFAESLNKKCKLSVSEAAEGDRVSVGKILIAPGGYHMIVSRKKMNEVVIKITESPFVNGVRPAADVLFESICSVYENLNVLVVILTGMGSDGTQGVMKIKNKCNCYCISQSESTCVVYGMPRNIDEAKLSDETADLKDISSRICEISAGRR